MGTGLIITLCFCLVIIVVEVVNFRRGQKNGERKNTKQEKL